MKQTNNNLSWLKLDNAALIYPAMMSRKIAAMFRFTVTLKERVDKEILTAALHNIMPRFPSFNYTLKEGLFWFYLDPINDKPEVGTDYQNPMLRIHWKQNKNYMFRVRVHNNRIAVEFFHALTDGTGGLIFILTLTAEYLKLKYSIKITYNDLILNPNEDYNDEELEDSFIKYARETGALEHERRAYHISGVTENYNIINIITGKIPINKLKNICKKYNATITEFLTSLMLECIEEISKKEIKSNKKPIKVSIPVNLRKIYKSRTLRNFSSYVNVGIDPKKDNYQLDNIIKIVKKQMKEKLKESSLNAKISGNVNLTKKYFIRVLPSFIKKRIMSIFASVMGDGYISTTFSNIGLVEIPKELKKYISEMNFIIGRSKGKSTSVSAIGYNNRLYISFSRNIKESEFERLFFTKLVNMGLDIEIESNR